MKITIVRQQRIAPIVEALHLSCPVCEREVEMLTGLQATTILEVSDEMLDRLVAAGQVHSLQTVSGRVLVCKDSLFSD